MIVPAILLAFIVNLGPLALGSDRPLPWAFNAAFAGGLLLLTLLVWSIRWRQGPQVLSAPIAWPLACFVVALIWIAIQIAPMGNLTLAHPIWSETSRLFAEGGKPRAVSSTISVSSSDTIEALMNFSTALTIGVSAYIIGRAPGRASFLLNAFVVSATIYGLYGLYRLSTAATQILWFDQENNGFLTATFMNRNHAATYFGLAMIASFALLSREWRHAVADQPLLRERVRRLIESLPGKVGIYVFLFASLLITLLLTGSRAGISAALVALAALIFLQHLRARQTEFGGGTASLSGALLGLFALLAIFEMSGARFAERLMTVDTA